MREIVISLILPLAAMLLLPNDVQAKQEQRLALLMATLITNTAAALTIP